MVLGILPVDKCWLLVKTANNRNAAVDISYVQTVPISLMNVSCVGLISAVNTDSYLQGIEI